MPNWCSNSITITGTKEKLDALKEKLLTLNESEELMGDLIGLGDVPVDYEDQGWYGHHIMRYGTKWDYGFDDAMIEIEDEKITMTPETAWSPPVIFLEHLCKIYDVVGVIVYFEPGMDFAGRRTFDIDGVITSDEVTYLEGLYKWGVNGIESMADDIAYSADNMTKEEYTDYILSMEFLTEEERQSFLVLYRDEGEQLVD